MSYLATKQYNFDMLSFKMLDESLQEDSLLQEDMLADLNTIKSDMVNWVGGAWNWLKGVATGTYKGKVVESAESGNMADKFATRFNPHSTSNRGIAGLIKSWFGMNGKKADPNSMIDSLRTNMDQLGDWMRNNSAWTTGGLAAAGLLGTYYLYKKWKANRNKKLDKQTLEYAAKLDAKDPSKMTAQEKNQKVGE